MSTLAFLQTETPELTASLPNAALEHSTLLLNQPNALSLFKRIRFFPKPVPAFGSGALACALPHEGVLAEIVSFGTLIGLKPAWADLAGRALEPNAFLEPGFAIPLFQDSPSKKPPVFLLAWTASQTQDRGKLIGLLPLSLPTRFLGLVARGAEHKHTPLGTPLLDRGLAPEALRQMLDLLQKRYPKLTGLILSDLPLEGPIYRLLCALMGEARNLMRLKRHRAFGRSGTSVECSSGKPYLFDPYQRAALSRVVADEGLPKAALSAKKRKQYRQQRRRLSEMGTLAYRTASNTVEIAAATEAFLRLESQGWKGARKTAFLSSATEAAFFRSMTKAMGQDSKCRIDGLELDGKPIAMGVVLMSGDRAFYWKTAYDEDFAALSPGVQLTLELTQTQLACASIAMTDSCAIANHPMIDHIWKDRLAIADVLVPIRPSSFLFTIVQRRETARRALMSTAKSLAKRLLRRH